MFIDTGSAIVIVIFLVGQSVYSTENRLVTAIQVSPDLAVYPLNNALIFMKITNQAAFENLRGVFPKMP